MLSIFAAAAVAAANPAAAPPAVDTIEITVRRPVVGTLQHGVQAYRGDFFTAVRPGTAMDMIQWLPGFTFDDTRDLRGLGAAGGNVLIDGQPPTSKNETLASVLRRIPAAQVDRVDLIVGGAPGIDMRGRSVIANVVLKKTGAPKATITASTNLWADGRVRPELMATASRRSGERTFDGAVTVARRAVPGSGLGDGPLVRRDGDGRTLFEAASRIGGQMQLATGSGAYQFPLAGGKLKLNASANVQQVKADERAEVIGSAALYTIAVVDTFRQGEAGARYERGFGRFTLESQALQRLNGHDQTIDSFRPPVVTNLTEADTLSESVARSVLRFNRDPRLSLEASAEGARNGLQTHSVFRSAGVIAPLPAANIDITEWRGEAGTVASWKPNARFSATAALKVETSRLTAGGDVDLRRDLTYWKPRVVLSWSPDGRTQLRLRGEHEVNQINFGVFSAQVDAGTGQVRAGNPSIRPRRAWVGEATLERQFWTGGSVVLTARRSALRDVIDQLAPPALGGAVVNGNIGSGRQTEVVATATLPLKRLGLEGVNLKGSVTARWSQVTDPTTGDRRRLSGQSPVVADVHFSHDLPALKLTWGVDAVYTGAATVYQPWIVQRIAGVTRVSAFVEYRLRPDLNLRLEGFNLTDPRQAWSVETYDGLRGRAALAYSEERRPADGPYVFLRVRKTIG